MCDDCKRRTTYATGGRRGREACLFPALGRWFPNLVLFVRRTDGRTSSGSLGVSCANWKQERRKLLRMMVCLPSPSAFCPRAAIPAIQHAAAAVALFIHSAHHRSGRARKRGGPMRMRASARRREGWIRIMWHPAADTRTGHRAAGE